ncbi:hypothetical protein K9N50_08260 [bacterium]|nr:hypothetical protein [bacterium]
MEIRKKDSNDQAEDYLDEFVISLGSRPKIRTDAITGILDLLEWRYQLAESVIFHPTKLCASAMLDRAIFELYGEGVNNNIEASNFFNFGDDEFLSYAIQDAKKRDDNNAKSALKLLLALSRRQLYEGLYTRFFGALPADVRSEITNYFSKTSFNKRAEEDKKTAAKNRLSVLYNLEKDFDLEQGSLAMYCPNPEMNKKIAKVKIAYGNDVLPLDEYEDKHTDQLTGGHLKAQINRFSRLWRIHFVIDKKVKDKIKKECPEKLDCLRLVIDKLVLHHTEDDEKTLDVGYTIAKVISQYEKIELLPREEVQEKLAAWKNSSATNTYRPGILCIREYFKKHE